MLHSMDCVQYYTRKGGGSDLTGFAHDSANIYLTHAE